MTALEKITAFVGGYPGADILREFQIDYTDQIFIKCPAIDENLVCVVDLEFPEDIRTGVAAHKRAGFLGAWTRAGPGHRARPA